MIFKSQLFYTLMVILLSLSASGDILYLNFNDSLACQALKKPSKYSDREIVSITKAAKDRGEKVVMVPACDNKIYPENNASEEDRPSVLSPIQLCNEIDKLNVSQIQSIVFSGHDGGGDFSGVLGKMSVPGIQHVINNKFANVDIKGVYLWGCYSNVPSEAFTWNKLFPKARIIVGFESKSALNPDRGNSFMLEDFLKIEKNVPDKDIEKTLLEKINRSNREVSIVGSKNECPLFLNKGSSDDPSKRRGQARKLSEMETECFDPKIRNLIKQELNIINCYRYSNLIFSKRNSSRLQEIEEEEFADAIKGKSDDPSQSSAQHYCENIPREKIENPIKNDALKEKYLLHPTRLNESQQCLDVPEDGKDSPLRKAYGIRRKYNHCLKSDGSFLNSDGSQKSESESEEEHLLLENPEDTIRLIKFKHVLNNYRQQFKKELELSKIKIKEAFPELEKNNPNFFKFIDDPKVTRSEWLSKVAQIKDLSTGAVDKYKETYLKYAGELSPPPTYEGQPLLPPPNQFQSPEKRSKWLQAYNEYSNGCFFNSDLKEKIEKKMTENGLGSTVQLAKNDKIYPITSFVRSSENYISSTSSRCVPMSWLEDGSKEKLPCNFLGFPKN